MTVSYYSFRPYVAGLAALLALQGTVYSAVYSENEKLAVADTVPDGPVEAPPDPAQELRESMREKLEFAKGLYARKLYSLALEEFRQVYESSDEEKIREQALYGMGETHFSDRKYAEALKLFTKFELQYPDSDQIQMVNRRTAESYYFSDKKEMAAEQFKKLVKSEDPEVRYASRYFAGKILFENRKFSESRPYFEELHSAEDESNTFRSYASYYLAEISASENDFENADKYFQEAFESGDKNISQMALFGAGKLMFEQEQYNLSGTFFLDAFANKADREISEDALIGYLKALYSGGAYNKVISTYQEHKSFVTNDENRVTAAMLNARSYEKTGRPEQAGLLFKDVFSSKKISTEVMETAQVSYIDFLIRNNQSSEALELLKSIEDNGSVSGDRLQYLKAVATDRMGDTSKAVELYSAFLESNPESEYYDEILVSAAYLHLKTENYDQASRYLGLFVSKYEDHEVAPKAMKDLILALVKTGNTVTAISNSKNFMKRYPDTEEAKEVHSRLAALLSEAGRHDEAEKIYQEHMKLYPDHNAQSIILAAGYNRQNAGKYEEALGYYRKIDLDRADDAVAEEALTNLAFCAVKLDLLDEAAAAYLKLISRYPDHLLEPEIYFWMAEYFVSTSDNTSLETVLDAFVDHPEYRSRRNEWDYYSAELDRILGLCQDALARYDTVIGLNEAFVSESHMGKGRCYRKNGEYENAIQAFNLALRAAGDDNRLAAQNRMEIGNTYSVQDRYSEAAKAFLAVGILYEDNQIVPEALFEAATAFSKAGELAQADQIFTELTDRFPNHPLAAGLKSNSGEQSL